MRCIRCGYESSFQFYQCPACGAVQAVQQPVNTVTPPYNARPVKKKSGGESAAIIIAIIISALSFLAAIVIFNGFVIYLAEKTITSDDFNIDSFDNFNSDENFEDFFNDFYTGNNEYGFNSPAGLNTPITFEETLYSFSEGEVKTKYEVSMIGTYRGEAALKLLDGAKLPIYNEDNNDIYLVNFSVKIVEQDKDALVTLPISNPAAYSSKAVTIFSDEYSAIAKLDYKNKYALIGKGDNVETWIAFIADKNDESPFVFWNRSEYKSFQNKGKAVSDPNAVESGAALEIKTESEDASSSDSTESD